MNIKVTCPECGSDQLQEHDWVLSKQWVTRWELDGEGKPGGCEYEDDEVVWDCRMDVATPFWCTDCNTAFAAAELKVEAADGAEQ
jgi:hypothetical protein